MTKILALDTSTDACSVALHVAGENLEIFKVIPRKHTHELLPMIEQILAQAQLSVQQLDAIAFARGPGSFAGIRIATGVTQGLAFAADLPVLPVSTLAALAQGYVRENAQKIEQDCEIITALDARMDEIYWASYRHQQGALTLAMAEQVSAPEQLLLTSHCAKTTYVGVGSGFNYLASMPSELPTQLTLIDDSVHPHALDILQLALGDYQLGKTVSAEQALPVYLRNQVTWKKKDQQ